MTFLSSFRTSSSAPFERPPAYLGVDEDEGRWHPFFHSSILSSPISWSWISKRVCGMASSREISFFGPNLQVESDFAPNMVTTNPPQVSKALHKLSSGGLDRKKDKPPPRDTSLGEANGERSHLRRDASDRRQLRISWRFTSPVDGKRRKGGGR